MTTVNTPIKIGSYTLKNRITFAPTVKFDFTDDSGVANEKLIEHYVERAKGGCGASSTRRSRRTEEPSG